MYAILGLLLALVVLTLLPSSENVKEWFTKSKNRLWIYPIFLILLITAVWFGLYYEVLHPCVLILVGIMVIPYIWGLLRSLWFTFYHSALKLGNNAYLTPEEITLDSLAAIGLRFTEKNENGEVFASLDGKVFFSLTFSNRYTYIAERYWASWSNNDPNISNINKLVHFINGYAFGPWLVVEEYPDEGKIYISTMQTVMLHGCCPENIHYISATLKMFYDIKETFQKKLEEAKLKNTAVSLN